MNTTHLVAADVGVGGVAAVHGGARAEGLVPDHLAGRLLGAEGVVAGVEAAPGPAFQRVRDAPVALVAVVVAPAAVGLLAETLNE